MAGTIQIISSDEKAQSMLAKVGDFGIDPPMSEIAAELEQLTRQSFRNEATPFGAPWPQHAPGTVAARRRKGNASRQRLIDSGRMYASIRREHGKRSAVVSVGEGLSDPRAVVHQFGTNTAGRNRSTHIPARAFFPRTGDLSAAWWERLRVPVFRGITEAIKK